MPDGLTLRQAAFAAEYIRHHGNQTRAALAAGYAPSSAYQRGHELVKHREVKKRIEKLTRRHEVTAERVLTRLDNLSAKAEEAGNFPAAVKAEELLGKALGLFIDRSVSLNVDINGSHLEAIRALAARRSNPDGGAGAKLIDATPNVDVDGAENQTFHNVGYTSDADKSVVDQQVKPSARVKHSRKAGQSDGGDNI